MSNKIRGMTESHLAVEDAMAGLVESVKAVDETSRLDREHRDALQKRSRVLLEEFVKHVEMGHNLSDLTERVFGEKPVEVDELDVQSQALLTHLQELTKYVETLDSPVGTDDPSWQQLRQRIKEVLKSFETCGEQEWAFYSQYATILFPGGAVSE